MEYCIPIPCHRVTSTRLSKTFPPYTRVGKTELRSCSSKAVSAKRHMQRRFQLFFCIYLWRTNNEMQKSIRISVGPPLEKVISQTNNTEFLICLFIVEMKDGSPNEMRSSNIDPLPVMLDNDQKLIRGQV